MTTAKFYDTDQIDARVPNPTGQTQGNVLTIGATGPEWAAPGGSGVTAHRYTNYKDLGTDLLAHTDGILKIDSTAVTFSASNQENPTFIAVSEYFRIEGAYGDMALIRFYSPPNSASSSAFVFRLSSQINITPSSETDTSKTVTMTQVVVNAGSTNTVSDYGTATIPASAFTLYY